MSADDKIGKFKNSMKKTNKKGFKKDIELEIDFYEFDKKMDEIKISDYKNIQYLSTKEKSDFDNKFSKPKNYSQEKFLKSLKRKDYKIVIASGPAGTGKTLFGIEQGLKQYINGNIDKLIFTRPVVNVDEDIGYLPGTLEQKMSPYVRPIFDIIYNFISPKEVEHLLEEKIFEIAPLAYLRGRTFKNCWIIADEMQNSTVSQMKMLLTRIGENSRLIITGDLEQHDRHGEVNGLEDFLNRIKGRRSDSISSVEFNKTDIEREDVVKEVLEIYETNKIPYEQSLSTSPSELSIDDV
jgi:phosphate starvation-inducible PhoH-like protein